MTLFAMYCSVYRADRLQGVARSIQRLYFNSVTTGSSSSVVGPGWLSHYLSDDASELSLASGIAQAALPERGFQ